MMVDGMHYNNECNCKSCKMVTKFNKKPMEVFFKEEIKPTVKDMIQISAEYLANVCLENESYSKNYTDDDLMNATLIFIHFLGDVIWSTNQNLTMEARCELNETVGKMVRELILSSTGKDTWELAKK